jgi:hypothetical protein
MECFKNQKSNFGSLFEGLAAEDFVIFMAIWYTYDTLVYFPCFGIFSLFW